MNEFAPRFSNNCSVSSHSLYISAATFFASLFPDICCQITCMNQRLCSVWLMCDRSSLATQNLAPTPVNLGEAAVFSGGTEGGASKSANILGK